jgi:hypothetical protein
MSSNPLAPAVHEEGPLALIYRAAADGADWRPVDRANAVQEGWDLLPRGAGPVVGNRPDRTIFSSDTEAMRHVQQSAAGGSEMHRRALAIHCCGSSPASIIEDQWAACRC